MGIFLRYRETLLLRIISFESMAEYVYIPGNFSSIEKKVLLRNIL